jgi:hypothetical protein
VTQRKKGLLQPTGMLTPRERVWQSVRSFGMTKTFTTLQVEDGCSPPVRYDVVSQYLRELQKAGYLQLVERVQDKSAGNRFPAPVYKTIKTDFEAPRVTLGGKQALQGLGRLAMWRAMRSIKRFDFRDIARAASHPEVTVSETTARLYIYALHTAGYLTQLRAPTRQLPGLYTLTRYTGRHAPALTRRKVVVDRNTGEFPWQETAQEVVDGLDD